VWILFQSEQRRLEFERRKKEIAEQQPKVSKSRPRRPTKDGTAPGCAADGSDRIPKKRPKKPGVGVGASVAGMPGSVAGLSAKTTERSAADYSLMAEQVQQQLQQLPQVTLQEPEVRINYAVWPMLGSSVFSGESLVMHHLSLSVFCQMTGLWQSFPLALFIFGCFVHILIIFAVMFVICVQFCFLVALPYISKL